MAHSTLSEQLTALEKELANSTNYVVREALHAQISATKKKIAAKAGRSTTLSGKRIVVGSIVYSFNRFRHAGEYNFSNKGITIGDLDLEKKQFGVIREHYVTHISPDGSKIAFGADYRNQPEWKSVGGHYDHDSMYYPTLELAREALIARHADLVRIAQDELEKAMQSLAMRKFELEASQTRPIEVISKANAVVCTIGPSDASTSESE